MSKNKQPAKSFRRKTVVIATEIAIGLMAAPLVYAQTAERVEKLEITGTRIPPPNLEASSPVNIIGAEDIKIEGVRNVENLLNNLPQVFADQGGSVSNGATGTATVNLRNFGADRTLVLVNGRRLPAGSPGALTYAADLNQIPAALIQRVEVLTGGASAIYGSDAIAGVVNFIMNDKFQGVQGEINYGFYNHQQNDPQGVATLVASRAATNPAQFIVPGDKSRDGEESDYNLTLGSNFADGRGNATIFLGYKKTRALLQSERDYSSCALGSNAAGFTCGGSSTSFPGRFIDLGGTADHTLGANGNPTPFTANALYNYGPLNYYQRPSERYTAAAFGHYDVNPNVRVYTELMLHDDQTVAQIAPSGMFGLVTTVGFDNPLLTPAWRSLLGINAPGDTADMFILRRNVEGGGRQDTLGHSSYRGVIGVKGEVAKHWNYDVSIQHGRVNYSEAYLNDFSFTRSGRAMDVVTDPATGAPACRSALDGTDPGCVPYNIWSLGGVTPEALAYLQIPLLQKGYTSQSVQTGSLSADLGNYGIKFPAAKSGVGIAFGAERRVEKLENLTDIGFSSGDGFGQGGPRIGLAGQYTVKDIFMEVRAPLIEGGQFMDLLSVNGSVRYSDYSTGKSADSYGMGIDWAPVKNMRFRGSYQQAVRAANVIELFQAQGVGLYDMDFDPCAGPTPARSLADCARTGVTAAQYGRILDSAAGQYNQLQGGNPDLEPETGKTATVGMVLTPMRDFNVTVDYFQMKVEDVISTLPSPTVLQLCLDSGQFCNLITRDALGTLWATPQAQILATNQNLSKWKTSGVDLSLDYTRKLQGMGTVNLNAIGTYLKEFKQEPIPGLGEYDCAGLYGSGVCGTPLPEWRHKFRTTWQTPWNFDLSLTWRYIDEVKFERTSSNPLLSGAFNSVDEKLAAQNYIDIAGSWNITKNLTLRGGINNLLDRDPPLSSQVGAGFGNGNTYPQVYDALGRKVFASLTAKF